MTVKNFGSIGGLEVKEALLESGASSVSILSFGAVTRFWNFKTAKSTIPILLGFDSLEAYQVDKSFIGIVAGRVANRTKNGCFKINNMEYQLSINDGPNHLHGGEFGFGKHNWDLDFDSKNCAVQLRRVSPHLEEGYPGAVEVTVTVTLRDNTLSYDMRAVPDRTTPISLAQHNYYNLMGFGDIWDHQVESIASQYTPSDKKLIPNGKILDLRHFKIDSGLGPWDLASAKTFNQLDDDRSGIDINLVLPVNRSLKSPVVKVTAKNGIVLQLFSDQPGLQLYSGKNLSSEYLGHNGKKYDAFQGFCLEPQKFPSSLTIPSFPSIMCSPDCPYTQVTSVKLSDRKSEKVVQDKIF